MIIWEDYSWFVKITKIHDEQKKIRMIVMPSIGIVGCSLIDFESQLAIFCCDFGSIENEIGLTCQALKCQKNKYAWSR